MVEKLIDPKYVEIEVRNLSCVWAQSQRPYKEKWAKQIADEFDPDKFDPIVVTKPNGEGVYHIIEGQHRRHALEMYAAKFKENRGDGSRERAPCRVVDEADPARAAEIWLGINSGRKPTSPLHMFKVAVTAQRKVEVEVERIVITVGYRIPDNPNATTNCITAVSALKYVYTAYGPNILLKTLTLLRRMWGTDPAGVKGSLIRGMGQFANEFGYRADPSKMRKIALRFSPHEFTEAAKARKINTQETLEEALAENFLREYNRGLKEPQKLKRK